MRDADGSVAAIVEQRDATADAAGHRRDQLRLYAFDGALLADALERVATDNAQGEEYLTDVVGILRGRRPRRRVRSLADDAAEIAGRQRPGAARPGAARAATAGCWSGWMRAGVTIMDPASTWMDVDVTLEQDAVMQPGTQLQGATDVGPRAPRSARTASLTRHRRSGAGATCPCTAAASGRDRPRRERRAVRLPAPGHQARPRRRKSAPTSR